MDNERTRSKPRDWFSPHVVYDTTEAFIFVLKVSNDNWGEQLDITELCWIKLNIPEWTRL